MKRQLLIKSLRRVFNMVDPMGLYFSDEDNIDEYDSEIESFILRDPDFNNSIDIENKLKEVFIEYFEGLEIDEEKIRELAKKISQKYLHSNK